MENYSQAWGSSRMEHRHNPRQQIELDVLINSRAGFIPGRAVELSEGGAFVEVSAPVPQILPNSVVELVLTIPGGIDRERYRLPALVVHSQPHGVGLMFPAGRHEVLQLLDTVK